MDFTKIKGIIFDLDGVIIDSEALHFECYKKAFRVFDRTITQSQYNEMFRSKGRKNGLKVILQDEDETIKERISQKKDDFYQEAIETGKIMVFQDALELIRVAHKKGLKLAVGTASFLGRNVIVQLGLEPYFDVIVTGQDVLNNKPAPDIYDTCAKHLGRKDELVVIEDSPMGVIAAVNSGIQVIYIKRHHKSLIDESYLKHNNIYLTEDLNQLKQGMMDLDQH